MVIKKIARYMGRYKLESIMAPLLKMTEALFDLFVPLVMARIINRGISTGDREYIYSQVLILVVLGLSGLACSITAQYFAAKASVKTCGDIRHDVFAHIHKLAFSDFDKIGISTLITRMTSDVNQVQNGLNLFLRLFLRSPFIVFGSVIMAFTVDAEIAWIFVIVVPILAAAVFWIMLRTMPMYKETQGSLDAVTEAARENLTGARVVRAFGREEYEESRFKTANGILKAKQLSVGRISALMNPLSYVIINIAIIAVLWAGAAHTDAGIILKGEVIALVNYMGQILIELVKLANLIIQMTRAAASFQRIDDDLGTVPSMTFGDEKTESDPDNAVRFEHVSLKYHAESEMENLQDVSFSVKRGETVGIIGGTGSGKTSLAGLITRFYDATAGNIELFGRDIKEYSESFLRQKIHIVQQAAGLFSGTVRSNLAWGSVEATDEEMWTALRIAQAEDFVREKGGLSIKVEQNGRNFSGGQRQRLSIARALVGSPEILILDDSASALDFATDAALRAAIKNMGGDTTVFIISQRAGNVQDADQIIVLDDGMVSGIGTHSELMETCEVYRDIFMTQYGGEEAEG